MSPRETSSINPNQSLQPSVSSTPYALLGWLTLSLPVLVLLSVLGYRKYQATVRQQRIRKLERIWQLSPTQKRP